MQTIFLDDQKTAAVVLLGDRRLRLRCDEVTSTDDHFVRKTCSMLSATLEEFRLKHGFGRAMAAPQIGINLRIIAFNLNAHRFSMINPRITEASQEKFTMWDDCMSFPDLLVRVERNTSVSVEYLDEQGTTRTLENLPKAESELIQHEIDHLDGILAIDRAMDKDSIIYRTVFKTDPGYFCSLVDYVIS